MDETLPVAVVDEEANPPKVIARFATLAGAEYYIGTITDGDKVNRGGFGIDVNSQLCLSHETTHKIRNVMFISRDGRWRVEVISRDGQQLYRITHKGMRMNGHIPLHGGPNRLGPIELADGWWLAEDTPDPTDITKWVPLKELEEHDD